MKTFSEICSRSVFNQDEVPILAKVRMSTRFGLTSLTYYRLEESCGDDYTGSWLAYSENEYEKQFAEDNEIDSGIEESEIYACSICAGQNQKRSSI